MSTLTETAEQEALLAEAEYENLPDDEKLNGKANGAAAVASKPGEQGIATQDEPEESNAPTVWERQVGDVERKNAQAVLRNLENNAHDMGAEAVVEGLIAIVDVIPEFTVPHSWPGETSEEYRATPVIERIGLLLCRGCPKIEISGRKVKFLWRNKKTWTRRGQNVHAVAKSYGTLLRHESGGFNAAVIANYQIVKLLNTRKKVRAVYKALRSLDANGVVIPNQFEGFYDELELFGSQTSAEDQYLARAIEVAQQRELPFANDTLGDD